MVIGIAPHINSAFGTACSVHIIAKTLDVRCCRFIGLFIRVDDLDRVIASSFKPKCILISKRICIRAECVVVGNRDGCRTRLFETDVNLQAVFTIPGIAAPPCSNLVIFYFYNIRIAGNSRYTAIRRCVERLTIFAPGRHSSKLAVSIPKYKICRRTLSLSISYLIPAFDFAFRSVCTPIACLRHCADGKKPEHQHKRHQR